MNRRWLRNFLISFIGALALSIGLSIFTATTATTSFYYTVTEVSCNVPPTRRITSMNDAAQIIGYYAVGSNYLSSSYGFVCENGTIRYLQSPSGGEVHSGVAPYIHTSQGSMPCDINNNGQVVGSTPNYHIFMWGMGEPIDLGILGSESDGIAINDMGQVVAGASLWESGIIQNLGTLGGPRIYAAGINNRGQVVGYSQISPSSDDQTQHAFLWNNGTMTDLGTLGGRNSSASDINNRGQVVGYSEITTDSHNDTGHAFLWNNGTMTDLGTLGGPNSSASDIDNRGKIVGVADTPYGSSHAFIWHKGKMIDLNRLIPANSGWELLWAKLINNNGQILARGRFNGLDLDVLLTPTRVTN